jgi:hypothetical protein
LYSQKISHEKNNSIHYSSINRELLYGNSTKTK